MIIWKCKVTINEVKFKLETESLNCEDEIKNGIKIKKKGKHQIWHLK